MFPVKLLCVMGRNKEAVVIDPGCFYEEEKQALKKFILTNELNVKHLPEYSTYIWITSSEIRSCSKNSAYPAEANKADESWIDEAPKLKRDVWFSVAGSACTAGEISARR